jgi:hypothetical protein
LRGTPDRWTFYPSAVTPQSGGGIAEHDGGGYSREGRKRFHDGRLLVVHTDMRAAIIMNPQDYK